MTMKPDPLKSLERRAKKLSRKYPKSYWYAEQHNYLYCHNRDTLRRIATYLIQVPSNELAGISSEVLQHLNTLRNDSCLLRRYDDAMLWHTACKQPELREFALNELRKVPVNACKALSEWIQSDTWYAAPRTDLSVACHRITHGWSTEQWERLYLASMVLPIEQWMKDDSRHWHHTERSLKTWKSLFRQALEIRDVHETKIVLAAAAIAHAIEDPRSITELKEAYTANIKPYRKMKKQYAKWLAEYEARDQEIRKRLKEEREIRIAEDRPIKGDIQTYGPLNLPEGSMIVCGRREELGWRFTILTKENMNITKFIPIEGSLTYEI